MIAQLCNTVNDRRCENIIFAIYLSLDEVSNFALFPEITAIQFRSNEIEQIKQLEIQTIDSMHCSLLQKHINF